MSRTRRMVASTVAIAALGVTGAGGAAIASNYTNTCTHGVATNNSGHNQVVYEGARNSEGTHVHKYKHDVSRWKDHRRERNC